MYTCTYTYMMYFIKDQIEYVIHTHTSICVCVGTTNGSKINPNENNKIRRTEK